jgi:hypothetical protein
MYDSDNVEKWCLEFVNKFIERGSMENYDPHITIADGNLGADSINYPTGFQGSKIAIYQLGNYCTCREVLFEHQF